LAEIAGFQCVRCTESFEIAIDHFGCPICEEEVPSNLEVKYVRPGLEPNSASQLAGAWGARKPGVWRYSEILPIDRKQAVSLGEGGTPLVRCHQIGESIGLPHLLAKNEAENPTWSFKDRMAAVAVSWARATGRKGIAVSSSGNAGASAAAYAARAGMPCIIFTTRAYPGTMQRFMRSFGAMVVATPTALDRWTLNRAVAREWGWLAFSNATNPPVGSHPIGIEGYKSIAVEICEDLDWKAPDAVIVPVAYGDALAGIHRGFKELIAAGLIDRHPRLIAAETYPSLSLALANGAAGPVSTVATGSKAFSVGTPQSTYQALRAIRESAGTAVQITDREAFQAHRQLRDQEGLFVELSSALPLAAARRLREVGELAADATVVLLLTSSGLKDSEVTDSTQELPIVEPELGALSQLLKRDFAFVA
jgi:threonine synthase